MPSRTKVRISLVPAPAASSVLRSPDTLLADPRSLVQQTRQWGPRGINFALVLLYWQVGQRIPTEFLNERRAVYREEITLRVAEVFPARQTIAALSTQLSGSHFVEIIPPSCLPQKQLHETVAAARARGATGGRSVE